MIVARPEEINRLLATAWWYTPELTDATSNYLKLPQVAPGPVDTTDAKKAAVHPHPVGDMTRDPSSRRKGGLGGLPGHYF